MQKALKDILKEHDFKLTPQRKAVIETLTKSPKALSAHDLFLESKKIFSDIGLATVYRTLDMLEFSGVLGQVKNRYAPAYFLDIGPNRTLTCTSCGHDSPEPPSLARALEQAEKEMGLKSKTLKVVGICRQCAGN